MASPKGELGGSPAPVLRPGEFYLGSVGFRVNQGEKRQLRKCRDCRATGGCKPESPARAHDSAAVGG